MPINFPADRNEVANRQKTDVQNSLSGSNPWLRNSWLWTMIVAVAGRVYDFYYQLQYNLVPNLFPWSATSIYLQLWGGWVGLNKTVATQATGPLVITGNVGGIVPAATEYQLADGTTATTSAQVAVAAETASITIARVGTLATATTSAAHSFATGQSVTISGADQSSYNGVFQIIVVDNSTFTFTVAGSPTTPATGTIIASSNMAVATVTTTAFGAAANQDSGTPLTISTPIAGIDSTAYVGLAGLAGGLDAETDDAFRARVQYRYQNPVTLFNDAAITAAAMSIAGVTRVWVEDCEPDTGQVTIYFVCDGQSPITPTAGQIADVKAAIMAIAPAQTDSTYVIVGAPTLDEQDFTFSALVPDTTTMQAAIEANLAQSFLENGQVSASAGTFAANVYNAAIFGTVDVDTGAAVTSFTLSTPTTDISVTAGHLPVLGTVTFP